MFRFPPCGLKEARGGHPCIQTPAGGPWLVLDTACQRGIVAVVQEGSILAEAMLLQRRRHAEQLAVVVAQVIQKARLHMRELAGVAVGQGPGSFIGVRIGVAYAKGVGCALGIPVLGLPTLLTLAASEMTPGCQRGLVVLGARRGEVFVQPTRSDAELCRPQENPFVLTELDVEAVAKQADEVVGCDLTPQVANSLRRCVLLRESDGPSAKGLTRLLHARLQQNKGKLQEDECEQLSPLYLRPPDAQLP